MERILAMATSIPVGDNELQMWATVFYNAALIHRVELGLTEEEVEEIGALASELKVKLREQAAAHRNAIAATTAKDTTKSALTEKLRDAARTSRANKASGTILTSIGIGPINPKTRPQPQRPLDLIATAYTNGTNLLRWKPGGNKPRTVYVIEVMNAETERWKMIASTTKCSFRHYGQEPGYTQWYRVTASRSGNLGIPSASVVVYAKLSERKKPRAA